MRLVILCTLFVGVVNADQLLYEVQQPKSEEYLLCPDQNSKCPQESTCCQMPTGQWGCCPFARASCCSDQVHCCPQGYSCNANKGQCAKAINNDTIPWTKKQPSPVSLSSSSQSNSPSNSLTCADGSVCPGTAACCRTYSGSFRCCPYPNDVCCSDGHTCCPRCTICDIVNRRCISGFTTEEWKPLTQSTPSEAMPAAEKTPAVFIGDSFKKHNSLESSVNIKYCNSTRFCHESQTCCYQPSGNWGCCPYALATCCKGSTYCCPFGKQCSNPPGTCF